MASITVRTNTMREATGDLSFVTHAKESKDVCFKVFIVVTVILAALIVIAGILALMACKSSLPEGMGSLSRLSVIGEVNSYVMLGGGIVLFVLGILALSFQIRKENERLVKLDPFSDF